MRKIFLGIMLLSMTTIHAQINGTVNDGENKPLVGVSIQMFRARDTAIVKTAVTDNNGQFSINTAKPEKYFIRISSVGFNEAKSATFDFTGMVLQLPPFRLDKRSNEMSAVVVKTQKAPIEVRADKMIFNVDANPAASGQDGIELLRLSPGVLVDHEDNISISGKSGVQIFIDGKPSPLSGRDMANFLRSLRSSAIDAIEIINNPSAKYDAAGTGGIINIRLKKNSSLGTNGSFTSDYQQGKWARFNNGIGLNNRNNFANIFANVAYAHNTNEFDLDVYRHVLDSIFDGYSATVSRSDAINYKAGLDRFLSKYSTIGFLVSGTAADTKIQADNKTFIRGDNTPVVDRILVADNRSDDERKTMNANINFVYNNGSRSLNMDADYGRFTLKSEQFQPNEFYNNTQSVKLSERNYSMSTPSEIDIWSFKTDYEQDFKKGRLALGMKSAFINSDNTFTSFNHVNNSKLYDSVLSNNFVYKENINAVYVSYNKSFKTVQVMLGLRLEQTSTEGTSTGFQKNGSGFKDYKEVFTRNLLNLFPSGNITFTKNPKSQWTISYSRRINRPSYQDLNPFEKRGSEYGGFKGNPALRPEMAHSFSLVNVFKSKLVTNLSYTVTDDVIVSISDTLNGTKSFYFPKNLAQQKNVSLNTNYTYSKKSVTINFGATGFYTHNRADFGPGREVDLKVMSLTTFVQPLVRFNHGWSANMRAMYESPKLFRGTMKQEPFYAVNVGVQKMLLKEQGTLRVNFNDVFNTAEFFGESNFAGQFLTARAWWDPRRVVVSFSYRFGSNQVKSTRQRKTGIDEEARRTENTQ